MTLGEFVAWIIGWDLLLEYLFGVAAVAKGVVQVRSWAAF
jgi:APA family basic amino acid/polyamine antiporter